jgi:hypothetical protein
VVVTVQWKEGKNDRTFELGQYLTNPQQGGMVADLEAAGLTGANGTSTTGNADGTSTTGTTTGAGKSATPFNLKSGSGMFGGK